MMPTDPLYASQWHFALIGDIETIWDEYSGNGVNVGVYDSGVDYNHVDLVDNYDPGLHIIDDNLNPVDPFPNTGSAHGTAVAGLIGAAADNGHGGVGVAHGVTLTGVNIFDSAIYGFINTYDTTEFMDSVSQAINFDIMSNSWGSTPGYTSGQNLLTANDGTRDSFAAQLHAEYGGLSLHGRGGLGTINAQAAGNDNLNANGSGTNASRHTITIAATEIDGTASDYSNFGSGVLVTAPAAAVTTDITGAPGYDSGDYTTTFNGTSAATPVVSGVISLMLEANETLGWRDVQNILANSASLTGSTFGGPSSGFEDGTWYSTGAGNFNGGGHTFHVNYGYGMVDAFAAVRMAEVWTQMTGGSAVSAGSIAADALEEEHATADSGTIDVAIPGGGLTSGTITNDLVVADAVEVETIMLTLDITHSFSADLEITLIAPDGTRFFVMADEGGSTLMDNGFQWQFEIAAARGYSSAGTWSLEIVDDTGGDTGTLHDWQLDFYGSEETTDDIHTITEDYTTLAGVETGRALIQDTNGGTDWLNLVALRGDVTLDLNLNVFNLNSASFAGIDGATFENVALGDGNDEVFANNQNNEILGMRGSDTLHGEGGDDTLRGGADNDTLFGDSGADILDGGTGNDHMDGGENNDVYYVDSFSDTIFEFASAGIDTVMSYLNSYVLGSNVERLELLGSGTFGTGNSLNNTIVGNAENNVLNGAGGDDYMVGGQGNDRYYVGSAGDVIVEYIGQGIDTVYSYASSYTLSDHVERLELKGSALNGTGNSLGNSLVGNNLNNILNGAGGNDYMSGGLGDDRYYVGSAGDVVTEYSGQGTDTVYSYLESYTLGANVERLELQGSALNGTGNSLGNSLVGNSLNNVLDGASGNDYMSGGLGDDQYHVDALGDVVTEYSGQGTDTVHSYLNSYTLGANVERLELQGMSYNGTGNSLNNTLIGNSNSNILNGGAGVDYMVGGTGDDEYIVGVSGDVVVEYSGQGTDTVVSYATSYTLSDHVERIELQGGAVSATGNSLGNTMVGTSAANTLNGAGGNDYMVGGDGSDLYVVSQVGDHVIEYAGQGTDTVLSYASDFTLADHVERIEIAAATGNGTGNSGNNTLIGSSGANTLRGEGGIDYIEGKAGADLLYGGMDADVFIFNSITHSGVGVGNRDTLGDFASGDIINLSNIDANTGTGANDAFSWIGTGAFSNTAGELRYTAYGPNAIIQGDVDGDGVADFEIGSIGYASFVGTDFVL